MVPAHLNMEEFWFAAGFSRNLAAAKRTAQ
jgi:hypothetical protein